MKRIGLALALVAVLALPGAALAAQGGKKGERGPASRACAQLRAKMGVANFRAAFAAGHKPRAAFGKCVSDQRRTGDRLRKLATEQCRQEADEDSGEQGEEGPDESEPEDTSGDESGEESGGELGAEGGADASLADCVANKLKRLAQAHNERYANAARTCKQKVAARKGRIARRGNAFGRCVRALVRAGDDEEGGGEVADEPGDEVEE
jgi:hypothetical protein